MKKNIIPDSSKILSTFENKYATPMQMPPMFMRPPQNGMPMQPQQPMQPMQPQQPVPPQNGIPQRISPVMGPNYIQGYLQQFIGQYIRIDFLVGTGTFIDRDGILTQVGIDFIELREVQTGNILVGDLYSIKFVTVYTSAPGVPYTDISEMPYIED